MDETPSHPWLTHPSPSSASSILLISAASGDAEQIARTLEIAGHRVLPAVGVSAACRLAEQASISAVIFDLPTGTSEDLELLDWLEREPSTAGAPKLLLTDGATPETRVDALRRGADDVLSKPCHDEELIARLERRLMSASTPRQPSNGPLLRHALTLGSLPSPITVGRYQATEVIGQGAMGVVLRGEDPRLQRPVAIKVLGRSNIDAARWANVAEMEHEGAALAHFDHPHIVKVYDAGLTDNLPFLVMELVEGESLDSRLKSGPLSAKAAIRIAVAVAGALAEAHGRGWVHRDIKPANILLGRDGSIKVTDFGLAGLARDCEQGNRVFGTPGYAPPECLLGEPHTPLGDLFALGSVIFYMLAGRPAFAGDSIAERLATTLAGRNRPLEEAIPDLPRALYQLVESLIDPLPSARPATARLVTRRLEWLAEAMAYQPVANEDLEPAETVPIGTSEIVN
ncbi:MAG: protein kinase [Acidobacteriota bacterium]